MIPASGYHQGEIDLQVIIKKLEYQLNEIPVQFHQLSQIDLHERPAPGKWSKKEILGHLIDSAINNLKRFTEIQFMPLPYMIVSYKQNELVEANKYQTLEIEHLLMLWQLLNRQIIFVVQNIPKDKLDFLVDPQYANKECKTLQWVIADYVAHMEHHARQIFG